MGSNNSKRVIAKANAHATNINRLLKRVKFTISIDFICTDNKGILITTNNVASASDLNIIEKYVKELNDVDHNNIISLHFLQLKSYLKVLGISYPVDVMIRGCGQTLGLGLGQSKDIVVVIISLQRTKG